MSDKAKPIRRFLSRLLGSSAKPTPDKRIDELAAVMSGAEAVALTEACVVEAAGLSSAEDSSAFSKQLSIQSTNLLGRALRGINSANSRSSFAAAIGLAMAGSRATVFLSDAQLASAHDQLLLAANRRLPLVVHLRCGSTSHGNIGGGHSLYHAVADAGAVLLLAQSAQDAVDLSLIARRLSEHSLVPVVVALDDQIARSTQEVKLPTAALVQAYLGAPEDQIEAPTPAQEILFGDSRRRVPRSFSLERPTMQGARFDQASSGLAIASQGAFFYDHVPTLLASATSAFAERTGRECDALSRFNLGSSQTVLVAQGEAVEIACAVADYLREKDGASIGVLGVRCLRPLSAKQLSESLANATHILVLERCDSLLGQAPPLTRELQSVLPGRKLRSVLYGLGGQPLRARDLASLCQSPHGASPVYLGIDFAPSSEFPKRQAALDKLKRAYPDLGKRGLRVDAAIDARSADSLSLCVFATTGHGPDDIGAIIAGTLQGALGGKVRTHESATWDVWDRVCSSQILHGHHNPGQDIPVDAAMLLAPLNRSGSEGLATLRDGGVLVVESALKAQALFAALPSLIQTLIGQRSLTLYQSAPVPGESTAQRSERLAAALLKACGHGLALRKLLSARETTLGDFDEAQRVLAAFSAGFESVSKVGVKASDGGAEEFHAPSPTIAAQDGSGPDNLPRFWSEVGSLYHKGEASTLSPDPYLATGAIPGLSSAFRDQSAAANRLPVFSPAQCTGCARCWSVCPEGAISPLVIGGGALIEAGMSLASAAGTRADALRPMLSKLAPRFNKHLKATDDAPTRAGALLDSSCRVFIEDSSLPDARKLPMLSAFDAVVRSLETLPLAVTEPFFGDPEAAKRGAGELLSLAINPGSCKECGACVLTCEDDALTFEVCTVETRKTAAQAWSLGQSLPDTAAASLDNASKHPSVGVLGSLMLSRHCTQAMAGGNGTEPGSGAALALRIVLASAEKHLQQHLASVLLDVRETRAKLGAKINELLSAALPTSDLDEVAKRLAATDRSALDIAELASRGNQADESGGVDVAQLSGLVDAAKTLERIEERLGAGPLGVGRARHSMVLAPSELLRGIASFPHNSFQVPTIVDASGEAPALAQGALQSQLRATIVDLAALRRARLELKNTVEAQLATAELTGLGWTDLDDDEKRLCPPLLLVGASGSFDDRSLARLLDSNLPIKILLLSESGLGLAGGEGIDRSGLGVLGLGLAHRRALVLQSSLAFPDHLATGLQKAFEFAGPAVIQIHAPSPKGHGFETDGAIAQARLAVTSRTFPLFLFDPDADGVFGTGLDISGNPEPTQSFCTTKGGEDITPETWAKTEHRFDSFEGTDALKAASDRRQHDWQILQELAGLVTPFTEQVANKTRDAVAATHTAELKAQQAQHEQRVAQVRAEYGAEMAQQIKERLMSLAGYSSEHVSK